MHILLIRGCEALLKCKLSTSKALFHIIKFSYYAILLCSHTLSFLFDMQFLMMLFHFIYSVIILIKMINATQNKGPFFWDLNEEASPEHDLTDAGHAQDQNTVEQSSLRVSPKDHIGVTGRRSTPNRRRKTDMSGLKSIINCDIHHKGCIHWDKLTRVEKGYQYTKMKRKYNVSSLCIKNQEDEGLIMFLFLP